MRTRKDEEERPVVRGGVAVTFRPSGTHLGLSRLPLDYFAWLVATLRAYGALTQVIKVRYLRRFKIRP
jgi:Mg2+-importing ATPase